MISRTINPLPEVDDWAMLPDGTIAIVRKDYHVDYIDAERTEDVGAEDSFDWQRLTDSAKRAIIDSTKARVARVRAARSGRRLRHHARRSGRQRRRRRRRPGRRSRSAERRDGLPYRARRGRRLRRAAGRRPATLAASPPPISIVEPSELPDYQPAFTTGSVRADREGKLWVRIFAPLQSNAGPEYDVIDRTGKLVDRVALPVGHDDRRLRP